VDAAAGKSADRVLDGPVQDASFPQECPPAHLAVALLDAAVLYTRAAALSAERSSLGQAFAALPE
jgi:hypothetical protein